MSARGRWAACAALVVVAALLAHSMLDRGPAPPSFGGSSTADSVVAPPAESTPTAPSASVSVTADVSVASAGAPPRPDASRGLTIASAEATVRYFITGAGNYLKLTGDGGAWLRVSNPACHFCSSNATYFAATNSRNKRLTGAYAWQVTTRSVRLTGPRSAAVDVNVRTGRHAAVERPGAPAMAFPGGVQSYAVTLADSGGDWTVLDVRFRQGDQ